MLLPLILTENELRLHQRHSLENFFQAFQEKGMTEKEREFILEAVRVFIFWENEGYMDQTIEGISGEGFYWPLWSDFKGDRDGLIEMIRAVKDFDGGLEKLFIKYLFEVFELEEISISYGLALEHNDQITSRLADRLENHNQAPIASELRVHRLGHFFGAFDSVKYYRIKSILADLVPLIFPDKKSLDFIISEIEKYPSKKVTNRRAEKIKNFLKESFRQD